MPTPARGRSTSRSSSSVTLSNLSLAGSAGNNSGYGLNANNSSELVIQNVNFSNLGQAVNVSGGSDLTLTGCNFTDDSNAINLSSIGGTGTASGGPIYVAGNNYTDVSGCPLSFGNLGGNLIISNTTAAVTVGSNSYNPDVVIENSSGFNSDQASGAWPLNIGGQDNGNGIVVINGIDTSYAAGGVQGYGIAVNSVNGVTIQNVDLSDRNNALSVTNGSDLTLTGCNFTGDSNAISLSSIGGTGTASGGPIYVAANNYTDVSGCPLSFGNLGGNLIISNTTAAVTVGSNSYNPDVVIENSSGFNSDQASGAWPLNIGGQDNGNGIVVINGIDASYAAGGVQGYGIAVNSVNGLTIQNVNFSDRANALQVTNGSDLTLTGCNFTNDSSAISLSSISGTGTASGGPVYLAANNYTDVSGTAFNFSNFNSNLVFSNTTPAFTLGGNTYTPDVVLGSNCGLTTDQASGAWLMSISSINADLVIEGIDASYTGGGQSGYGITVSSVSALLVDGVTVDDRGNAMQVDGSPMTITNSAFLDNGTGLSTNAASGANIDGSNQQISNCWLSGNSTAVSNGGAELLARGNFWGGNGEPSNLGGTGDSYSGSVNAGNWLSGVPTGVALPFAVTSTSDPAVSPSDPNLASIDALVRSSYHNAISLREAIIAADNTGSAQTIPFDIGTGPQTIALTDGALPAISSAITLDGSTQPGFNGTALITIDGSGLLSGAAVAITGSSAALKYLNVETDGATAVSVTGAASVKLSHLDLSSPSSTVQGTGLLDQRRQQQRRD